MKRVLIALACLFPGALWADGLIVSDAVIPAAPPGAMTHAAYMVLNNDGDAPVSIIGVQADGYAMAHVHRSQEVDGVATMSSVDVLELEPGQTLRFERGGYHVMLMRPDQVQSVGQIVTLALLLEDGSTVAVEATVARLGYGS